VVYRAHIHTHTQVQAVMARELGLLDEAELICRRALLSLSLKHSVAEPTAEPKNVEQEW
jgi:hypothetical protein